MCIRDRVDGTELLTPATEALHTRAQCRQLVLLQPNALTRPIRILGDPLTGPLDDLRAAVAGDRRLVVGGVRNAGLALDEAEALGDRPQLEIGLGGLVAQALGRHPVS